MTRVHKDASLSNLVVVLWLIVNNENHDLQVIHQHLFSCQKISVATPPARMSFDTSLEDPIYIVCFLYIIVIRCFYVPCISFLLGSLINFDTQRYRFLISSVHYAFITNSQTFMQILSKL